MKVSSACLVLAALGPAILLAAPAAADGPPITVADAWAPSVAQGGDAPVSMTVVNTGEADELLRARCAPATFVEKRAVDRGEGFPSARPVKSIPVAAKGETRLQADGLHLMLIQTSRPLAAGDAFTCNVTFRGAGSLDVEVKVRDPG